MPEINSIPYENAEDLNLYLYDNYYSTENIVEITTLTGFLRYNLFELSHETGVTQNSTCKTYYDLNYFNPLYGQAVWKCYMNSMDDVKAFFGFKETLADPIFPSDGPMVESHAGFIVDEGKLYASVGNGTDQQYVEIVGIDMTRVENYKIEYNKFFIEPLPETRETMGIPGILTTFPLIVRDFKLMTELTNYPPENVTHYIMQFIKNNVGADKKIKFNRFIFREVYADYRKW